MVCKISKNKDGERIKFNTDIKPPILKDIRKLGNISLI